MGYVKAQQVFSGTLSGSGLFSGSSDVRCADFDMVTLEGFYLSGASGGAWKFYVQTSADQINWIDTTVKIASASVSGGYRSDVKTDLNFVESGTGNKRVSFYVGGEKWARVQVAEYGVTGSPGNLVVKLVLNK